MPRQKDFKRLVRTRMRKTGESYTAARAQLLRHTGLHNGARRHAPMRAASPAVTTPTSSPDYAALAGISDERVQAATACSWEKWVYALDRHRAHELPHRELAKLIRAKYRTSPWWTQSVAVGYERIKGLRAIGQRRDGTYEANKSRTFAVRATVLFDAWRNAARRRRWLGDQGMTMRTATKPKYIRFGMDDGSVVVVGFTPRRARKSSVAIQHERLDSRKSSDAMKAFWAEKLDDLGAYLART